MQFNVEAEPHGWHGFSNRIRVTLRPVDDCCAAWIDFSFGIEWRLDDHSVSTIEENV